MAGNPDEWVSAAALHERSGVLYIANTRDGLLRKYDADGALVAEASKEITPVVGQAQDKCEGRERERAGSNQWMTTVCARASFQHRNACWMLPRST